MSITARQAAKKTLRVRGVGCFRIFVFQKILYFAHMACLGEYGEPLIDEQFHAWLYGPVIPNLYA